MQKVGIFYGSNSGNTEEVAQQIKDLIGNAEVHDVGNASVKDLEQYENIIFGSSTWGSGDLQDDFDHFIDKISGADLSAKKVAIFGLGDSSSYGDTFCNSIGHIYNVIKDKAQVVGSVSADDYSFEESEALIDGQFVGLPIDVDNESKKTDQRIEKWLEILKASFN